MADWKKIAHEYITTGIDAHSLAEKHGVSYNTLKKRAAREEWMLARKSYNESANKKAVKKYREKTERKAEKKAEKIASDAELIMEGASLAINWIIKRLNSDEVSDWREVEGLLRALNGAKALTKIKMGLDNEEQRARIDNLKKQTEVQDREPVQIEFVNAEGEKE